METTMRPETQKLLDGRISASARTTAVGTKPSPTTRLRRARKTFYDKRGIPCRYAGSIPVFGPFNERKAEMHISLGSFRRMETGRREWINKKYNKLMEEQAKYEVNVTPEMEELLRQINALPIDERQELLDIIDDSIENDAEWAAIEATRREAGTEAAPV